MDNNGKINSIVENLKKLYQQEYGIAVFDIDVKNFESGVEIKGSALTENQRDHIINIFKEKKIKIRKENLKILSDAHARNEIGWVVVKSPIADLKLRFVSGKIINQRILKRIRCSQAFKGEVLRVLYKNEDQLLVQQNDLTLGWVDRKNVVLKKKSLYKEWASGNFAVKGKVIKITNKKIAKRFHINTPPASLKRGIRTIEPARCHSELVSESIVVFKKNSKIKNKWQISKQLALEIIKEAKKYLNAKYVFGGKSKKGIDCSGLVQAAYKNSLNIILPKHSWDQKKMGKKVELKDTKTGDLIFLIKKENSHKHVGIVEVIKSPQSIVETQHCCVSTAERSVNLIHASLEKKKVVKQSLEKVFENYDFVEARRIIE